jgi:hypothetical protein
MVSRYTSIPVASVIAFDMNASTSPLQSEYIIMQRMSGVPADVAFRNAASRLTHLQLIDAQRAYFTQLCGYINQLHTKMPHARGIGALTAIPTPATATTDNKEHQQWFDDVITIDDADIVAAVYNHYDNNDNNSIRTNTNSRTVQLSLTGLLQDGAAIGPFTSHVRILLSDIDDGMWHANDDII